MWNTLHARLKIISRCLGPLVPHEQRVERANSTTSDVVAQLSKVANETRAIQQELSNSRAKAAGGGAAGGSATAATYLKERNEKLLRKQAACINKQETYAERLRVAAMEATEAGKALVFRQSCGGARTARYVARANALLAARAEARRPKARAKQRQG